MCLDEVSEFTCVFLTSEEALSAPWNADSASYDVGEFWRDLRSQKVCCQRFMKPVPGFQFRRRHYWRASFISLASVEDPWSGYRLWVALEREAGNRGLRVELLAPSAVVTVPRAFDLTTVLYVLCWFLERVMNWVWVWLHFVESRNMFSCLISLSVYFSKKRIAGKLQVPLCCPTI